MPLIIEATYSKKVGLPNFSSHGLGVTIRKEIPDDADLAVETAKLRKQLQRAVDSQLRNPGFVPDKTYGVKKSLPKPEKGKIVPMGMEKGKAKMEAMLTPSNGWACTDEQRAMILNLVDEYDLKKAAVEKLAKEIHGVGVRALTDFQADRFIRELQHRRDSQAEAETQSPAC